MRFKDKVANVTAADKAEATVQAFGGMIRRAE